MQEQEVQKPPSIKLLLTIEEAADALSMSRRFIYMLVATHQIYTIKLGRSRRVPVKALQEFIDGLQQVG
jgi:excisionase family DNA binding protein